MKLETLIIIRGKARVRDNSIVTHVGATLELLSDIDRLEVPVPRGCELKLELAKLIIFLRNSNTKIPELELDVEKVNRVLNIAKLGFELGLQICSKHEFD